MNCKRLLGLSVVVALAAPAWAHHSFAMFDFGRRLTFTGTVEEFSWVNPHNEIIITVPDSAGDKATVGRWVIEAQAPNIMRRQGWTKTTLKAGDKVTIVGFPMRDGSKVASLYYVVVNGTEMYGDPNRRPETPAPRPAAGGQPE